MEDLLDAFEARIAGTADTNELRDIFLNFRKACHEEQDVFGMMVIYTMNKKLVSEENILDDNIEFIVDGALEKIYDIDILGDFCCDRRMHSFIKERTISRIRSYTVSHI